MKFVWLLVILCYMGFFTLYTPEYTDFTFKFKFTMVNADTWN